MRFRPSNFVLVAGRYIAIVACAVALGWATPAPGQSTAEDRASNVKAAMVLNFLRYTEWPERQASAEDPIVLTLLGTCQIDRSLEEAVSGQRVHGRPILLRRLSIPSPAPNEPGGATSQLRAFQEDLQRSNAIFVCDSERAHLAMILEGVSRTDVLTVSDTEGFAERGGMLGLAIRNNRIAFDANTEQIDRAQLKVSSRLLRLAHTVKTKGS